MKEEELGNLEQLFLQSCGDKLKENGGFTVRGELGVFSSALVVWLSVLERVKRSSLSDTLLSFLTNLDVSGIMPFVSRPSRKT